MEPPTQYAIAQPAECREVKELLAKAWDIRRTLTHNPAPNPVSLHRHHLPRLRQQRYVVSEKTDGVRYQLVMGRFRHNKKPYATLVDRAFNMYQVQVYASTDFFFGTVWDGELAWNKNLHCFIFLVFDVVLLKGKSVKHHDFLVRYHLMNRHLLSQCEWNRTNVTDIKAANERAVQFAGTDKVVIVPEQTDRMLFLYAKPCVEFKLFGPLPRSATQLTHDSDGYLFTPIDEPVRQNCHTSLYKWKFAPTIDLQLQQQDNALHLYCQDGAQTVPLSEAFPEHQFVLQKMKAFTFKADELFIIETTLKREHSVITCVFHRFRSDKNTPNHVGTIRNILREVMENITLAELVELSTDPVPPIESAM